MKSDSLNRSEEELKESSETAQAGMCFIDRKVYSHGASYLKLIVKLMPKSRWLKLGLKLGLSEAPLLSYETKDPEGRIESKFLKFKRIVNGSYVFEADMSFVGGETSVRMWFDFKQPKTSWMYKTYFDRLYS